MAINVHRASEREPKQTFAQKLNLGVGRGLEQAEKLYDEYSENEGIKRNTGLDLSGIKDPNTRSQMISDQLSRGNSLKQAKAEADIDYSTYAPGEAPQEKNVSPEANIEKDILTSPDNKKGKTKNIPVTQPLLSNEQLMQKAKKNTQNKLANNIPTTFEQELNTLNTINNNAKLANQEIKNKQTEYGNKYVEKLHNVIEKPNDEIISLFEKKGENGFSEGKTEGEISADAAVEARKFKNTIANISKDLNPLIQRGFDKSLNSIKNKVQPLLDEGLFDTVRNLLDEGGAYPEQIEKVVSNLGEIPKKTLATLDKQQRPDKSWWESQDLTDFDIFSTRYQHTKSPYTPEQQDVIKNNVKEVLTKDPAANLILLREAYGDKDVEWDEYKNIIDYLVINGEIKLNEDQFNMLDTLDQPPLSGLEKFLKNLRLF